MPLVRYKDQTELAFLDWMAHYPWTTDANDMHRFYVFVKTVARYPSSKWRDDTYFEQRILQKHSHFNRDRIRELYWKMHELIEFYRVTLSPTIAYEPGDPGFYIRGVKGGEIYQREVTEAEFLQGKSEKNGH